MCQMDFRIFLFTFLLHETVLSAGESNKPIDIKLYVDEKGYILEEHEIQTTDGYLLTYHRIKTKTANVTGESKYPVLLQHSLITSSADFLVPDKNALAYVLVDAGFDVWLGNSRGNQYSRGHINLDPEENEYWNFGVEEMVVDVAAGMDYILNTTDESKVLFVGHSHGAIFPLMFTDPMDVNMMAALVALAPAAYLTGASNSTQDTELLLDTIAKLSDNSKKSKIVMDGMTLKTSFCSLMVENHKSTSCDAVLQHLQGTATQKALEDVQNLHPFGTSKRALQYVQQQINNGDVFAQPAPDSINYRQNRKEYNLTALKFPVHVFFSDHDILVTSKDINLLKSNLKVAVLHQIQDNNFNHADFVWGADALNLVFKPIVEILSSIEKLDTRGFRRHRKTTISKTKKVFKSRQSSGSSSFHSKTVHTSAIKHPSGSNTSRFRKNIQRNSHNTVFVNSLTHPLVKKLGESPSQNHGQTMFNNFFVSMPGGHSVEHVISHHETTHFGGEHFGQHSNKSKMLNKKHSRHYIANNNNGKSVYSFNGYQTNPFKTVSKIKSQSISQTSEEAHHFQNKGYNHYTISQNSNENLDKNSLGDSTGNNNEIVINELSTSSLPIQKIQNTDRNKQPPSFTDANKIKGDLDNIISFNNENKIHIFPGKEFERSPSNPETSSSLRRKDPRNYSLPNSNEESDETIMGTERQLIENIPNILGEKIGHPSVAPYTPTSFGQNDPRNYHFPNMNVLRGESNMETQSQPFENEPGERIKQPSVKTDTPTDLGEQYLESYPFPNSNGEIDESSIDTQRQLIKNLPGEILEQSSRKPGTSTNLSQKYPMNYPFSTSKGGRDESVIDNKKQPFESIPEKILVEPSVKAGRPSNLNQIHPGFYSFTNSNGKNDESIMESPRQPFENIPGQKLGKNLRTPDTPTHFGQKDPRKYPLPNSDGKPDGSSIETQRQLFENIPREKLGKALGTLDTPIHFGQKDPRKYPLPNSNGKPDESSIKTQRQLFENIPREKLGKASGTQDTPTHFDQKDLWKYPLANSIGERDESSIDTQRQRLENIPREIHGSLKATPTNSDGEPDENSMDTQRQLIENIREETHKKPTVKPQMSTNLSQMYLKNYSIPNSNGKADESSLKTQRDPFENIREKILEKPIVKPQTSTNLGQRYPKNYPFPSSNENADESSMDTQRQPYENIPEEILEEPLVKPQTSTNLSQRYPKNYPFPSSNENADESSMDTQRQPFENIPEEILEEPLVKPDTPKILNMTNPRNYIMEHVKGTVEPQRQPLENIPGQLFEQNLVKPDTATDFGQKYSEVSPFSNSNEENSYTLDAGNISREQLERINIRNKDFEILLRNIRRYNKYIKDTFRINFEGTDSDVQNIPILEYNLSAFGDNCRGECKEIRESIKNFRDVISKKKLSKPLYSQLPNDKTEKLGKGVNTILFLLEKHKQDIIQESGIIFNANDSEEVVLSKVINLLNILRDSKDKSDLLEKIENNDWLKKHLNKVNYETFSRQAYPSKMFPHAKLLNELKMYNEFLNYHGVNIERHESKDSFIQKLTKIDNLIEVLGDKCLGLCEEIHNLININDWYRSNVYRSYFLAELKEKLGKRPETKPKPSKSSYDKMTNVLFKYKDYFDCRYNVVIKANKPEGYYIKVLFLLVSLMDEDETCNGICEDFKRSIRNNKWFNNKIKQVSKNVDLVREGDYETKTKMKNSERYNKENIEDDSDNVNKFTVEIDPILISSLKKYKSYIKKQYNIQFEEFESSTILFQQVLELDRKLKSMGQSCDDICKEIKKLTKSNVWYIQGGKRITSEDSYNALLEQIKRHSHFVQSKFKTVFLTSDSEEKVFEKLFNIVKIIRKPKTECLGECKDILDYIEKNGWFKHREAFYGIASLGDAQRNIKQIIFGSHASFIKKEYSMEFLENEDDDTLYNYLHKIVHISSTSKIGCVKCQKLSSIIQANAWYRHQEHIHILKREEGHLINSQFVGENAIFKPNTFNDSDPDLLKRLKKYTDHVKSEYFN